MAKSAVTYNFPEARLLAARLLPYMRQQIVSLIPTQKKGVAKIAVDSSMRAYYDPDRLNEVDMETSAGRLIREAFKGFLGCARRASKYLGENPSKEAAERYMMATELVVTQIMEESKLPVEADAPNISQYGFPKNLVIEEYCMMLEDINWPPKPPDQPGGGQGQGQQQGEPGEGEGEGQQPGGQNGGGSCGDNQQKPWEDPKDSENNPGMDDHEQDMLQRITAKACEDHEREKGRGSMPGYLRRASREILKPKVDPVRELLAQVKFAVNCTTGHGDYTWKRLNRRQPPGGTRLPAHVQPIPRIMVVVDTSGSMSEKDLGLALGVVSQVLKALPGEGVTVVTGDTRLASVGKYFRPEQVQLAGGGGTDMAHLLKQAAGLPQPPDAIILATDGETGWPADPVGPRVVAAITRTSSSYPVPSWIKVVELNPKEED